MLDVTAIHNALAAQIEGRIARPVTVYPFDPGPGNARSYPCIVIDPGDPYVTYHETHGDNALCAVKLEVRVMIVADEIDQRIALADFVSSGTGQTSSVLSAIEADKTFGGTVRTGWCMFVSGPEQVEAGVLAATFDVQAREHRGS